MQDDTTSTSTCVLQLTTLQLPYKAQNFLIEEDDQIKTIQDQHFKSKRRCTLSTELKQPNNIIDQEYLEITKLRNKKSTRERESERRRLSKAEVTHRLISSWDPCDAIPRPGEPQRGQCGRASERWGHHSSAPRKRPPQCPA